MLKKYSSIVLYSMALLLFLLCFYFLLGPETVSLSFLLTSAIISIVCGILFSRLNTTLLTTILTGIIIPSALHFIVYGVERLIEIPFPQYDSLLISFDSNMALFLIPLYVACLLTFTAFRFPKMMPLNTAFFGILLLILSNQKHKIDIFFTDREFFLVQILFGVFLFIICAILLILSNPDNLSDKASTKRGDRGLRIKRNSLFLMVILFSLSGSFFLLTQLYTSNSLGQGGGLMHSDLFRFDFSDLLSLESKIEMSDDLILLFRKDGLAENYKIRRFVLNGYSPKKGFYRDLRGEGNIPKTKPSTPLLPKSPKTLPDPLFLGRTSITQEYYLLNINPTSLLALNYPVSVIPYQNWPDSSFSKVYKVESKVPDDLVMLDLAWIEKGDYTLEKKFLSYYTDYGESQRIKTLAREIVGEESSLLGQAKLIESYLQENYFYSLQPGLSPDGDQLSFFLFDAKKGYCSYFAFAMTLLCRSIDIPSRIAVGFSVSPENELLNFYPVLANRAHAWVEVYFHEYGWIEFDPTSSNIAPGEELRLGQPDPEEFISLLEEILKNRHNLNPELEETVSDKTKKSGSETILSFIKKNRSYLLLISASTLLLFYLYLRFRFYLFYLISSHKKNKTKYYFCYATALIMRLGFIRKKGETALAAAIRCENLFNIELKPLAEIYLKALFGETFSHSDYTLFLKNKELFLISLKILSKKRKFQILFNPVISLRRSF